LLFSPGTRWNYGVSLDVLGRVIEVVSGKPLDVYLRDDLFGPLGMRETGFVVDEANLTRFPTLYARDDSLASLRVAGPHPGECGNPRLNGRLFSGGGGLVSTVADYLRFAQMLLNGGTLDGRRVLSQASVQQIMQNHLPSSLLPPPMLGGPGRNGYGHGYGGVVMVDSKANPIPGAEGIYRWLGYYSTNFWIDPSNALVTMVWTQYLPTGALLRLDPAVQRAVYAALLPR
jgi:CubicO group peptidase (beta-lactamase class C family)